LSSASDSPIEGADGGGDGGRGDGLPIEERRFALRLGRRLCEFVVVASWMPLTAATARRLQWVLSGGRGRGSGESNLERV